MAAGQAPPAEVPTEPVAMMGAVVTPCCRTTRRFPWSMFYGRSALLFGSLSRALTGILPIAGVFGSSELCCRPRSFNNLTSMIPWSSNFHSGLLLNALDPAVISHMLRFLPWRNRVSIVTSCSSLYNPFLQEDLWYPDPLTFREDDDGLLMLPTEQFENHPLSLFPFWRDLVVFVCHSVQDVLELPLGARRLVLACDVSLLSPGDIPETVIYIRILNHANCLIPSGVLPDSLQILDTGLVYDQPLPSPLPSQLRSLQLGMHFRQQLHPESLPSSLRRLVLGVCYDRPLLPGTLPEGLETLEFDADSGWDHPLCAIQEDGTVDIEQPVLPSSLQRLVLSRGFNQILEPGMLPSGIRHLRLGRDYRQVISPGALPRSLEVLDYTSHYRHGISQDEVLPQSLRKLVLPRGFSFFPPTAIVITHPG